MAITLAPRTQKNTPVSPVNPNPRHGSTAGAPGGATAKQPPQPPAHAIHLPAFAKDGSRLAKDMLLARLVVRCPDFACKIQGGTVSAAGHEIKGKHSIGRYRYDVGAEIFADLTTNKTRIDAVLHQFSVVDAEDGFRMVPMEKREDLLKALEPLIQKRMGYGQWLDEHWFSTIVPAIQAEHPDHFEYILQRAVTPPFEPRLEVVLSMRPLGVLGPNDFDWDKLTPKERERCIQRMRQQADDLARERVQKIFDGLLNPIADLAVEINGQKPNPKFNPDQPEGPKNRKFLPGIGDDGKKATVLDRMFRELDRLLNFKSFLTPELVNQVEQARTNVSQAGGSLDRVKASATIKQAILASFNSVAATMRQQSEAAQQHARPVS